MIYLQELKTQPIQRVLGYTNLIIFYLLLWLTIQKNLKKNQLTQTNCRKTELKNRDKVEARRGGPDVNRESYWMDPKANPDVVVFFWWQKKEAELMCTWGLPLSPTMWPLPLPRFTSPTRPLPPFLAIFYGDFSSTIRAYSYFRWWYCLSFLSEVIQLMDVIRPCSYANLHEETAFHYPFYFGVSIGFVNPTWDGGFLLFFSAN